MGDIAASAMTHQRCSSSWQQCFVAAFLITDTVSFKPALEIQEASNSGAGDQSYIGMACSVAALLR
jgi:hypothetical protein